MGVKRLRKDKEYRTSMIFTTFNPLCNIAQQGLFEKQEKMSIFDSERCTQNKEAYALHNANFCVVNRLFFELKINWQIPSKRLNFADAATLSCHLL